MIQKIVVDCSKCHVRVSGRYTDSVIEPVVGDFTYFLIACPTCRSPIYCMAANLEDNNGNYYWGTAERIWPNPKSRELSKFVPLLATQDIQEAQKCLHNGLYSAPVVMCGRALEWLVKEETSERNLDHGLRKLEENGVIDKKLYKWATILRKERNLGAHANIERVTKENAEDVIELTVAIFDYVYTLTKKYEAFLQRKR